MGNREITVPPGTDFNEAFDQRFYSGPLEKGSLVFPTALEMKVSPDAKANYLTLKRNSTDWGMTGLVTNIEWSSPCYRKVPVGTIFLFPGSYATPPPPYSGEVKINCVPHPAMVANGNPLHKLMCELMEQPTRNFIGFSIRKYPFKPENVGYSSCTCNPRWFGTDCRIPSDSPLRQEIVSALLKALPHG